MESPFSIMQRKAPLARLIPNAPIKQLELLRPEIVVHRITSDPDKDTLVEPSWLLKKFCVLNDIDKLMKKNDTYQGIKKEGAEPKALPLLFCNILPLFCVLIFPYLGYGSTH